MTCRHLGMRPVAMLEENPRITVRNFMRPYPFIMGVPVKFGISDLRIQGKKTVESVSFRDAKGATQVIETDGVIVSGRFRPESALIAAGHLMIDPATGGPEIDQYGRASDPSYFCTGNLLRPVETSSWCWHEAVKTAQRVVRDLAQPIGASRTVRLIPDDPAIRYVVPQRLAMCDAQGAMTHMQIRVAHPVAGRISVNSGDVCHWSGSIKSRPERRVLAPLAPLLNRDLKGPVGLRIRPR